MTITVASSDSRDASAANRASQLLHPVTAPNRKVWEPELVEHVAYYAAERDDAVLERLCDDVLAGVLDEGHVFAAIRKDRDLTEWCARDQHYRRRAPDKPKAEADSDIVMIHHCRRALAGDRHAVHAYRVAVDLEQRMGGAL